MAAGPAPCPASGRVCGDGASWDLERGGGAGCHSYKLRGEEHHGIGVLWLQAEGEGHHGIAPSGTGLVRWVVTRGARRREQLLAVCGETQLWGGGCVTVVKQTVALFFTLHFTSAAQMTKQNACGFGNASLILIPAVGTSGC